MMLSSQKGWLKKFVFYVKSRRHMINRICIFLCIIQKILNYQCPASHSSLCPHFSASHALKLSSWQKLNAPWIPPARFFFILCAAVYCTHTVTWMMCHDNSLAAPVFRCAITVPWLFVVLLRIFTSVLSFHRLVLPFVVLCLQHVDSPPIHRLWNSILHFCHLSKAKAAPFSFCFLVLRTVSTFPKFECCPDSITNLKRNSIMLENCLDYSFII